MWSDGPLWYRGYYADRPGEDANMLEAIYQTLKQFKVSTVITGHTVVADSISTWYEGKVINIDTRHSDGHSEALLIERGDYFAIDRNGHKRTLFTTNETNTMQRPSEKK